MQQDKCRKTSGGKGRPPAPFKVERLAIATYRTNQGTTFKAAAEAGVIFFRYDFRTQSYVPDEVNAKLPATPAGRRTALYEFRRQELQASAKIPTRLFHTDSCANQLPIAFRFETPPKRGRPKKMRKR
jgi:hypothetical protein